MTPPGVEPPAEFPERIGRYRILSLLGQGGMGSVFEAEQDHPRRTVALKVLSVGVLNEELRRRFELEAEVLGLLQHPCIAQIYDAGVVEGPGGAQPYLAMERIRGVPLNRYASEHGLGLRERLELLALICDGVQHAHQRGVIHRDLKPDNILVDEEGQPKILDFGLARATNADVQAATMHTDVGQIMGTVPYMSPEQAAGDVLALDMRTDVYSLGVVAYELLGDQMPYPADNPRVLEALRVVREVDARPLGSVNRILRGDVETIIGKALEKDPERRYGSAADFAADLRRHLSDEPIRARPPNTIYQIHKFARRHKALMTGVAAVFLSLVVGLIGTARGLFQARAETQRAQRTADFFQTILQGVDPAVAQGSDTTLLKSILDDTAQRIEGELADVPRVEATIRSTMASAYFAISDYAASLEHARASNALFAREYGAGSLPVIVQRRQIGTTLAALDRPTEAEAMLRDTLALAEAELGLEHRETYHTLCELGVLHWELGRTEEAVAELEPVLAYRRRTLGDEHEETLIAVNCLGLLRIDQRRFDEARELLLEALETRRRVSGETHPDTIKAIHNLAGLYVTQEDFAEAETLYRDAVQRVQAVFGEEHDTTLLSRQNLAGLFRQQARYAEAIELQRAVYDAFLAKLGSNEVRTMKAENALALILREAGDPGQAEPYARHAYEGLLKLLGQEHEDTLTAATNLSSIVSMLGRHDEAEDIRLQLIELRRKLNGDDHPSTLLVLTDHGTNLMRQGRYEEAEALMRPVVETQRRDQGDDSVKTLSSLLTLSLVLHHGGQPSEAAPLLGEYFVAWSQLFGDEHPNIGQVVGFLCEDLGQLESLGPHEPLLRALLEYHQRTLPPEAPRIADDLVLLGEALVGLRRYEEAGATLESALERLGVDGSAPTRAFSAYGAALTGLERFEEAEEMLTLSWEEATDRPDAERSRIAERLMRLYEAWDRPDEAAAWRR